MFLGMRVGIPMQGAGGLWSPYSPALAALLAEASGSGLVLDFTRNIAFRSGTQSTITGVSGWTYTRSGTRFAGDSALTSFGANVPRIVPGSGIRVTSGATNLILQSETFDNASWVKGNTSITANAIAAPDGTVTADKIAENTTSSTAFTCRQAISVTTGTAYTASVYLRAAERPWAVVQFDAGAGFAADRSANFDLTNGVLGTVAASTTATITNVGGGWYRCTITSTATGTGGSQFTILTASANNTIIYTGVIGNGVHAWGAQLETGSTATDYIPTTTASATAGADAASVTGLTFSGAHSVIALTGVKASAGSPHVFQLDNGSSTDRSLMYLNGANLNFWTISGSALQASLTGAWSASAQRLAMRVATNDVRGSAGGTLTSVGNPAVLPSGTLSTLRVGANNVGAGQLDGWLQLIAILPRALSDTELQGATQ